MFVPVNFSAGAGLFTCNLLSLPLRQVAMPVSVVTHLSANVFLLHAKTMRFFPRQFTVSHSFLNSIALIICALADLCLNGCDAKTKDNGRGE